MRHETGRTAGCFNGNVSGTKTTDFLGCTTSNFRDVLKTKRGPESGRRALSHFRERRSQMVPSICSLVVRKILCALRRQAGASTNTVKALQQ